LRHNAFGVPTSSLVATACRFSDESETFQHIMSALLMPTYYKCNMLLIKCNVHPPIRYCCKSYSLQLFPMVISSLVWIENAGHPLDERWFNDSRTDLDRKFGSLACMTTIRSTSLVK
jgi:hypothetical protein